MSERRPSLIFRFAGLFTLGFLGLAALAYAWLAPPPRVGVADTPEPTEQAGADARWADVSAWVAANPGHRVVVCPWPEGLPQDGRVDVEPSEAPHRWVEGRLVQAVPSEARGGLVRGDGGEVRAWAAWGRGACEVLPPVEVQVQGRVEQGGEPIPGVAVVGCGQQTGTDQTGTFRLTLDGSALEAATADDAGRPQCFVEREQGGQTRTPVDLGRGGIQPVILQ